MNEHKPKGGCGFAFTFALPFVPRIGEEVRYASRRFLIADVVWRPHDDAWPVVLLAEEWYGA